MRGIKTALLGKQNKYDTIDEQSDGVGSRTQTKRDIIFGSLLFVFYAGILIYLITSYAVVGLITILSLGILVLLGYSFMTVPVLFVFCNNLQIPLINSGLFKYAMLFIMIFDIIRAKKIKFNSSISIQLLVCFLFSSMVLIPQKGLSVLIYIPILFYIGYLWVQLHQDETKLQMFCKSFVIAMLISVFVGWIQNNVDTETSLIGNSTMELSRFFATFNDPNYAGLFINAAICMCIIFKPFKPLINLFSLIVFYVGLIATASMTAIVCNLIILLVLIVIKYGLNVKTALVILGALVVLIAVFFYGLNSNIEVLNTLCTRIKLKFDALLFENNVSAFTSGRAGLVEQHWDYFKKDGTLFNWLFGGISSNALYCTPKLDAKVAHLEYLDLLLNIGLIGTILYLGAMISRFIRSIRDYRKEKTRSNRLYIVLYINYFVCGLSLTLFMEPQFFMWILM